MPIGIVCPSQSQHVPDTPPGDVESHPAWRPLTTGRETITPTRSMRFVTSSTNTINPVHILAAVTASLLNPSYMTTAAMEFMGWTQTGTSQMYPVRTFASPPRNSTGFHNMDRDRARDTVGVLGYPDIPVNRWYRTSWVWLRRVWACRTNRDTGLRSLWLWLLSSSSISLSLSLLLQLPFLFLQQQRSLAEDRIRDDWGGGGREDKARRYAGWRYGCADNTSGER